jgi:hypothetical protein
MGKTKCTSDGKTGRNNGKYIIMQRTKRLDIRVININGGKWLYRGSSVINEAKVLRKQASMKALRMHQRGTVGSGPKLSEQTTSTRLGAPLHVTSWRSTKSLTETPRFIWARKILGLIPVYVLTCTPIHYGDKIGPRLSGLLLPNQSPHDNSLRC